MIKTYVGAKIIRAVPQSKDGTEGYKVIYPDGYVSWSPKLTFDEAYREVSIGEMQLILQADSELLTNTITDAQKVPDLCAQQGHDWGKVPEWANAEVCRVCDKRKE